MTGFTMIILVSSFKKLANFKLKKCTLFAEKNHFPNLKPYGPIIIPDQLSFLQRGKIL